MAPTSHIPDPTDPADGDVVAYLAGALSDARDQLERAQSTIVTALVIARLAITRRDDDDGAETDRGDERP